jgi:hypothetical protein
MFVFAIETRGQTVAFTKETDRIMLDGILIGGRQEAQELRTGLFDAGLWDGVSPFTARLATDSEEQDFEIYHKDEEQTESLLMFLSPPRHEVPKKPIDRRGVQPESWACIDCGKNTAPGCSTRIELERAFAGPIAEQSVMQTIDNRSEVYMVKRAIWKAAYMDSVDGCLCIGCLEKRLGRALKPKDFARKHPFHLFPGTKRLLARRDGA